MLSLPRILSTRPRPLAGNPTASSQTSAVPLLCLHVEPTDDCRYVAGPIFVGRDGACDVRLDDKQVSRRHAAIYPVGGIWWIRDLESGNGTYLDDEWIDIEPLGGAARLRLGSHGPSIWLLPLEVDSRRAAFER